MLRQSQILCSVAAFVGLMSFATVAVAEGDPAPVPTEPQAELSTFISNGSVVRFDQDRASLVPISGWQVEPRGSGMALVMKEVTAVDPNAPVDYSKPLFARNISVMTLNEPAPIDEARAVAFEDEFSKMAAKNGAMKDFQFASRKFFNYKGENDGIVFFAQHTANNYQMMQMIVLVSGDAKQYMLTYTDLASQFSNQESYDAAWKSMTSILVPGIAPKRYMREMKLSGAIAGGLALLVFPFAFARFSSQRRIRRMIADLQHDWDNNTQTVEMASNVSHLDTTRVATDAFKAKKAKKAVSNVSMELELSAVSSFTGDMMSTRKRKFSADSQY